VEEEVQREWSKVEECCHQTPVLRDVCQLALLLRKEPRDPLETDLQLARQRGRVTYLSFDKDSSKAVEQLKWGDNLALNESARQHGGERPPSCACWHLPEPSLERYSTPIHDLIHVARL
jgi:hypothetical protein